MASIRTFQEITNEALRRSQRQVQRQNFSQNHHLSRLRRQAGELLRDTHRQAHVAQNVTTKQQEAILDLQQLEESHPEFTDLTLDRIILHWILLAVIPIIYLIDVWLFFQTALTLAHYSFTYRLWMVNVACYLLPLLVLGIEVAVASQMYAARHPDSGLVANTLSSRKWFTLGLVLMIVMPTLVISTHPALGGWGQGDHLSKLLTWQLGGFVALVIVTHFFVIFGGDLAHNAKAYAVFSCRRLSLRQTIRRCEAQHQQAAQAAVESFGAYWRMLDEYKRLDPDMPILAGPFDRVTRDLINKLHDYEVIEASAAEASKGVLDDNILIASKDGKVPAYGDGSTGTNKNGRRLPAPPQSPDGGALPPSTAPLLSPIAPVPATMPVDDGEMDGTEHYLRTLLTRQVRDEESEVRR
jgi:hypothetical protein